MYVQKVRCRCRTHSFSCMECCSAGTPLEVQKRKAVVPLLYIMSFLWLAQIVFAGKHRIPAVNVLYVLCISCVSKT